MKQRLQYSHLNRFRPRHRKGARKRVATPADSPVPTVPGKKGRSISSAALVAAGILLSRVAGLVRERVFAHYFGNSEAAGAFKAALRIPNFLQNLFGEGVLSASFIPVYSRLLAEGEEELAGRVAGIVASLLALVVSIVVLLGVFLTPTFVDLVAPGYHGDLRLLTVHIVQIMFPGIGVLVMSAWCLGILNSHRQFLVSYIAPVFWNLAMIGALIYFGRSQSQNGLAVTLAWATFVGAIFQFGVQLPFIFLKKTAAGHSMGAHIQFGFETALRPVRQVFKSLGPVVMSRGVVQMSAFIDSMIASYLGAGAVASLGYAQTIYFLPISLFGMAVAASELPEMSREVGTPEEVFAKLRKRLVAGQRTISFYVIPSVTGFLFLGQFIVAALYQTGAFGHEDTLYVWYILMGSTVGLLAATWGRLYSSAFYALRDTKTPLKFAIIRVILTGVGGYVFAFPLRPYINTVLLNALHLPTPMLKGGDVVVGLSLGAVGLTLSAGMAGWIEFLLLRRALQERIGSTKVPGLFQFQIWTTALVASLVSLAASRFIHTRIHWLALAEILAVFGAIYGGITVALGIPEARALVRRVR